MAGLSTIDIKKILRNSKGNMPADDFRLINSWAEYKANPNANERKLDYLCYEIEVINPATGETRHLYKALKLLRVTRLPRSAKESLSLMDMHSQLLSAVCEQQYNLVTIIANIIEPEPLGLLFLYGVQGVSQNLEEAKKRAHSDYCGLKAMIQGTYRVMHFQDLIAKECEWLREKMFGMDYMTVVRGIPKANQGGEDAGNKGIGNKNINPDSQGTLEEIISGMTDYEYVIQVLSTPVFMDTLRAWQTQTQKDMTMWNGQLQGTKSISANISLPMAYMANASTSQGWSHGYTDARSISLTNGESFSTSIGHTVGQSVGQSLSQSFGQSFTQTRGTSITDSVSRSTSVGTSVGSSQSVGSSIGASRNMGASANMSFGSNQGRSIGTSQNQGSSTNIGNSRTIGTSINDGVSRTVGQSRSVGRSETNSTSWSHSDGTSRSHGSNYGHSYNHSDSVNDSTNQGYNTSNTNGATESENTSDSHGVSSSVNGSVNLKVVNVGGSQGTSDTHTGGNGYSHSVSVSSGVSEGSSHSAGSSNSNGYNLSFSNSSGETHSNSYGGGRSVGTSVTNGFSESLGESHSVGRSDSIGTTQSFGQSQGVGQSVSENTGTSESQGYGTNVSNGTSVGQNLSNSVSRTNSVTNGVSTGHSVGRSESVSLGESTTTGKSVSNTTSTSDSTSTSKGTTTSTGTSSSQSISNGTSGTFSHGSSGSMGLAPSLGYNKSYQWLDQQVKDILELLEFQNERIKLALRGAGAFYTYMYIACPSLDALSAAKALAKSTWQNDNAMIQPLQVLDLNLEEQKHLLYHFSAFSSDITRTNIAGVSQYKYCTVLLPNEFTAYTHPPRISEGGIYAEALDVPHFASPSMMKGDIFMGTIISAERYSSKNGYLTGRDYRIEEDQLMHGYFSGASRSGKTVAAMRFVAELTKVRRSKTGKRLRIVCMDPKRDWRALARFVEPERFRFYSMGNPNFHPLHFNPCKIPRGVIPQIWVDVMIEIYCRAYGLLERGKQLMAETFYELYEETGVFDVYGQPGWEDMVPEMSSHVTFAKAYDRMNRLKIAMEDGTSKKGRGGNDTKDAYSRLLERLSAFARPFSIERRLFGEEDGLGIDDLIGKDDVTVLESKGLESTFKNFIFGVITAGFYRYAIAQEGGYLAPDQYETVLVIEEANEVLTGSDKASGGDQMGLTGQSEFEQILDQAAGWGLFIFAITQKIADMPKSVIANAGLIFAGKIKTEDDINVIVKSIAKDPRFDDRDVAKWFPRSPTGWFVCQSSRTRSFLDCESVLVKIAMMPISTPTDMELDEILTTKKLKETLAS